MTPDELAELAHLYATEGLAGEQLEAFEAWRTLASAEEKAAFAALVDSITLTTLAELPPEPPPADLKEHILQRVAKEAKPAPQELTPAPEAFTYLLANEGKWIPLPFPGARIKELSARKDEGLTVFLLEMDPNTRFPSHHHHGAEMAYVLEGDLQSGNQILNAGDFMRADAGSAHENLYSEAGCRALLITASENYPRATVGVMKRLRDVVHAARDLFRSKK